MGKTDHKGIWVFAEQENGVIQPTVYEILAKSQELKAYNGENITAVLLGSNVKALAQELITYGADQVLVAEHENLSTYSAIAYQQALTQLAKQYKPSILLFGATSLGRDLAPRMMITLETGLTADAIDLGFDEDGMFYQTTPAYGGTIMARIAIPEKRPQMATVRPKLFPPLEPDADRKGLVIEETVSVEADHSYKILETSPKQEAGIPIDQAKVIVSGGHGVKSAEEMALLETLADKLSGVTAASRPLVEEGFLPHNKQIGQSGATVKPELIINVGISGSVQYKIGMQDSGCVVTVNKDNTARLFDISDYGVVADLKAFIPALITEIESRTK